VTVCSKAAQVGGWPKRQVSRQVGIKSCQPTNGVLENGTVTTNSWDKIRRFTNPLGRHSLFPDKASRQRGGEKTPQPMHATHGGRVCLLVLCCWTHDGPKGSLLARGARFRIGIN